MKWGKVKQARQQIARMKGKYTTKEGKVVKYQIHNDAIDEFLNAQQVIRESNMSRAQKSAAMERAADQFLRSGMGTRSGIMARWEQERKALPEEMEIVDPNTGDVITIDMSQMAEDIIGNDWKKAAEYMDASKQQRNMMAARHYAGSETIQQLADAQKAGMISINAMYDIMGDISGIIASRGEISPDALQGLITGFIEDNAI